MNSRFLVAICIISIVAGCASNIPWEISEAPASMPGVAQVQQQAAPVTGIVVRWGGEIVAIENQPEFSTVEILARKLGYSGKPVVDGTPDARFLARVPGFLDPVDYQPGQRMTIYGNLSGFETRKVGEFPYRYPVVEAQHIYRWPALDPEPYYDPYWDRYYGPYWGPWGYPYHHHRHW